VKVTTRHGDPWITLPKLDPLPEPTGLQALKDEVIRRWGVLDLLDVLKNADFLTRFTDEFTSVAAYERIDRATLQRRLLLALFALGYAQRLFDARDAGASDQQMRQIIADGFKEIYFQDGGGRALGLSDVAINDIDYLDIDY
jgi:hypothetical protein